MPEPLPELPAWLQPGAAATWHHGMTCRLGKRPLPVVVERIICPRPGQRGILVRTADGRLFSTIDLLLSPPVSKNSTEGSSVR